MSYRFVKVTSIYPNFLQDHYRRFGNAASMSYADQHEQLMRREFFWSDYYAKHLRALGVDAHEIVANAAPLQFAWAREHGSKERGHDLLIVQLKELKPDVVFFLDAFPFKKEWLKQLRESVPSLKQIIGWCCAPFTDEHLANFRAFDYLLTCTPGFLEQFKRHNVRAYQINHAFESSLLTKIVVDEKRDSDFLFVGSLMAGGGYHDFRREMLERLVEIGVDVRIFGEVPVEHAGRLWLKRQVFAGYMLSRILGMSHIVELLPIVGRKIKRLDKYPPSQKVSPGLRACIEEPLYGLDMFTKLSRCKIGFNAHIDVSGEYAGNVRLFEVTGMGACLLTDWKKNLHELFDPENEIVSYRTPAECFEKVRWLLDNPVERMAIAKAGQKRCLRDHTFEQRSKQLHEIIKHNFNK